MSAKKAKGKKAKKVLGIIAIIFVLFIASTVVVTVIGNSANTKKANSFETVQIENQLVPEKDKNGYWTYSMNDVWTGIKSCYADLKKISR